MTSNIHNLDLVNINAYANFGEILSFILKIFSENEIMNTIQISNRVIALLRMRDK